MFTLVTVLAVIFGALIGIAGATWLTRGAIASAIGRGLNW